MNRAFGVFKMHVRDRFAWLYLPWIICLSSFAINLVVAGLMKENEGFSTGGIASLYVYLLVLGITIVPQTFPFTLGMGVRRTDYFAGTLLAACAASAVSTVLMIFMSVTEKYGFVGWGVKLNFFHLPFLNEGPTFLQGITLFLLMLNLFFSGFVIACIYRKFGRTGTYIFFTLVLLIFAFTPLLISYYDRWDEIGRWAEANIRTMNDLSPWLLLLTALYALASFGMLRRSTV